MFLFQLAMTLLIVAMADTGAQPETLRQAEEEALKNNLSLLAQRFDLSLAEADIITARLLPVNPALTLTGDVFPHPGAFALHEKNYSAIVAVPIELGGKRSARVEVAEKTKSVSAAVLQDSVRNLLLGVRTQFYEALNAKYSLELATSTMASLDSIVALNRVRLRARDIAESELARTEVVALQQHVQVRSARLDEQSALTNLQLALGRPALSPDFSITGELTEPPQPPAASPDEARQLAVSRRPDLQALRAQLEAAEANKKLQEALSAIDLSLGGYYSNQQGLAFSGLTLSLPLPIFDRNQGEIDKAAARVEQLRLQLLALERQIDAGVETAFNEFLGRREIADQMKWEIIQRSARVRDAVEYAYRNGGTSILDFLDAQRAFNEAMKAYYDALTSLHKSAFALRAVMGG